MSYPYPTPTLEQVCASLNTREPGQCKVCTRLACPVLIPPEPGPGFRVMVRGGVYFNLAADGRGNWNWQLELPEGGGGLLCWEDLCHRAWPQVPPTVR